MAPGYPWLRATARRMVSLSVVKIHNSSEWGSASRTMKVAVALVIENAKERKTIYDVFVLWYPYCAVEFSRSPVQSE